MPEQENFQQKPVFLTSCHHNLLKYDIVPLIKIRWRLWNESQNQIPVASIDWEVLSITEGVFDWKDYYKRSLRALGAPLIKKK